jgi:acetylglutamate synthase
MNYIKLNSFGDVDKAKFKELVYSGFGKSLMDNYFEYVKPKILHLIQDDHEDYIGAVVLEEFKPCQFYLDKLVVAKEYQKNGIGKKLWSNVVEGSDKLVWRAKPENPINNMYVEKCEGMQKFEPWFVYWIGLNPTELVDSIYYALNKKPTLI